jgi:hypothetical protein
VIPLHHSPAPKAQFILSDAAGGVEGASGPPPLAGEDFEAADLPYAGWAGALMEEHP